MIPRRVFTFVAATLLSVACLNRPAFGATPSGDAVVTTPVASNWMTDHLSIGTRITTFWLKNDNKETFLGSIDHLGDEQDFWPYKLYADYLFCPYGGLELTWDHVDAIARTEPDNEHIDGTFSLGGPILTAIARYPNQTAFTPYAGLGAAWYNAAFHPQEWWANGWESDQDYVNAGQPAGLHNNRGRILAPKDSLGFVATAGSEIKITKNISADLYFRYTQISTDTHFLLTQGDQILSDKGTTSIPFDNYAMGLGVKYVF